MPWLAPYGASIPLLTLASRRCARQCKKPSIKMMLGVLGWINSLTMSYFHTGIRTIIGAEAFHCPVRDGKEWDHLAMVIRHNRSPRWFSGQRSQFAESVSAVLIASPEAVQFRTTAAYIACSFWSFEP